MSPSVKSRQGTRNKPGKSRRNSHRGNTAQLVWTAIVAIVVALFLLQQAGDNRATGSRGLSSTQGIAAKRQRVRSHARTVSFRKHRRRYGR